jgi:acyl-CoA synthetase (AMP-forming)/AMP-acid ligase II
MSHPLPPNPLALAASGLTVGMLFQAQVLNEPHRIALEQDGRTQTFAQLNERVNRLVHALVARGVTRGDRVAMLSENRMEYVELGIAAAKLGVIMACQNWRLADGELNHCLRLIEPKLIIHSERVAPVVSRLDHDCPQTMMLGEEYERALARADAHDPPDLCDPEDGLTIIYTSGTTGFPKAAVISQRAMIARAISNRVDHPCDRDDNFIAWSPMFHVSATDHIYAALLRGSPCCRASSTR